MSDGIAGLAASMRGLIAVLGAVAATDLDMKRLVRTSDACRRLMTRPSVSQLIAPAFTADVDDPSRSPQLT